MSISLHQYRAIMAIVSCFEGDDPIGAYDLISVLADGGGISYGKHQATENGGALYAVVEQYVRSNGSYAAKLKPYLDLLYDGVARSRKDALTHNMEFRALLIDAARDDLAMRRAQDDVFNRDFYAPTIDLCNAWQIYLPLGVGMAYEQAIQYGPANLRAHWERAENGFDPNEYVPGTIPIDESLPIEVQNQMRTIHYLCQYMRARRAGSSVEAVQKTVYRSDTFTSLMAAGNWLLAPPFDVEVAYRSISITSEILDRLP